MVSMRAKFEALVRDLDKEALEQLRRSVTSEIDGRRETAGFSDGKYSPTDDRRGKRRRRERDRAGSAGAGKLMPDVRRYWQEIRAIEKTLPEFVWLAGVDSRGSIVEVAAARAAHLLHAKSHRFATEEEVAARKAEEAAVKESVRHERLRRQGIAIVAVRPGAR
jgi:hypothetical protein